MINKHRGFGLVELMIAMTLALIAVLAATGIYISSKQTNRLQSMQTRLTEDGRFVVFMLQRIISQAGFRPNPNTALITDFITPTSATSVTVKFTADAANSMACDGSVAPAGVQTLTIAQVGSKLQCGTVEWIAPASSGTGNGTELVDFKLEYGTDTTPSTIADYGCGTLTGTQRDGDCVVDQYTQAQATATPSKIAAVRVCLVLRTEAVDSSASKASNVMNCSNTAIANSQTDNKLYRTFRTTIQLRNR